MNHDLHVLDNSIWSALTGTHRALALGTDVARRYRPDISPLSALREPSAQAFDDLASLAAPGERLGLVRAASFDVPKHWQTLVRRYIDQMVCRELRGASDLPLERLGEPDIADMLALAQLTEPGPFRQRTIDMGRYYGIRAADGRLAAMTGERMAIEGFQEVSAVCTHPDFRGCGYAKTLVTSVTRQILNEGKIAFLHVKTENAAAKALYESLGYRVRCPMFFTVIAPP